MRVWVDNTEDGREDSRLAHRVIAEVSVPDL